MGFNMAEPESHTLRLLQEFRPEFAEYRKEFKDFREHTDERFDELTRLFAGESVLGRYAAAEVEKRLTGVEARMSTFEGRVSALEQRK
jgi:hypothetical protein